MASGYQKPILNRDCKVRRIKMKKYKAEITFTATYEIFPEYYPDTYTPEECLASDLLNFRDDLGSLFSMYNDEEQIKGRIIGVVA